VAQGFAEVMAGNEAREAEAAAELEARFSALAGV
jgi:hypothetical protein